jgi:DNA modification methylase
MPDESIDACVADVPYGLGSKEPSPEDLFMYVLGGTMSTGGDFMGKDWEIPSVAVWKEIFRVLKPGGHVLSFAGSRTADLIGFGLRMAGFESRDSIARCYPVLYWTYGSGMPKSHNIGKAIDKKLGKTRTTVVGIKPGHEEFANRGNNSSVVNLSESGPLSEGFSRPWMKDPEQVEKYHRQYAPETAQAAEWEGWGSGLKPAAEPILVFRKPLRGTLAHNVMTYGTGGLNIDATRVRHASKEDFETHKAQVDAVREKGGVRGNSWKNDSDLSGANEVKEGGRWPANLLLEHSAACRKVGTQTIAPHPQGPDRFQKTTGGDFSEAYGNQLAQDEPEVSPVWECAEGCPVRAMDDQSGDRPSTLTGRADPNGSHEHPGTEMNPNSTFLGERTHLSKVYADAGGASRFFTQIEGETGDSSKGRWPANLVLQHAEGCVSKGAKRVKRGSGDIKGTEPSDSTNGIYGKYSKRAPNNVGEDGFETIEAWECIDGCPVKTLDEQSGVLKSGKDVNPTDGPVSGFFGQEMAYYSKDANYGDEGGASRFYSQFDGVPFRYIAKANRKEAGCGEFEVQHVTVKPLELMRWLVKLVTHKGGVVLDPYCGSGSTLHAAVLEGMHYIGIERDEASYAEARRRLDIVHAREREKRESDDVFAFAMGDGA